MSCIYKITNPINKIYIGQTIDVNKRKNTYKKYGCPNQILLHNSIKKYGWDMHNFEILEICESNLLNEWERYWQDYYDVICNGLNLKLTKSNDRSGKLSNETRNKMKQNHANFNGSLNPFFGKKHTKITIEKIKQFRIGKHFSNNKKPVVVDNIEYESLSNACRSLKIPNRTMHYRLNSDNFKTYFYKN